MVRPSIALLAVSACAHLPTPYTAAQIRRAMPPGTEVRLENRSAEGLQTFEWTVVGADATSVRIRYATPDAPAEPIESADLWTVLRDHARFPREHATRERETFDSPLGTLKGWRYTVSVPEDGQPTTTKILWFADRIPGPPIRMEVRVDGTTVSTLEQVHRDPSPAR